MFRPVSSILPSQPFYAANINSDHRGLYSDFDTKQLFGNPTSNPKTTQRIINSKNAKLVDQFQQLMVAWITENKFPPRINNLIENYSEHELQECDRLLHEGYSISERKCGPSFVAPWYPALAKVSLKVSYWKLVQKGERTGKDVKEMLKQYSLSTKENKDRMVRQPHKYSADTTKNLNYSVARLTKNNKERNFSTIGCRPTNSTMTIKKQASLKT